MGHVLVEVPQCSVGKDPGRHWDLPRVQMRKLRHRPVEKSESERWVRTLLLVPPLRPPLQPSWGQLLSQGRDTRVRAAQNQTQGVGES